MKNSNYILLDTNKEMSDPVYEYRHWKATCDIGLPRRPLLDATARSVYDYKGTFLFLYDGSIRTWPIPDVYEVFGGIDGRWISYYRKEVGGRPRYKPRSSTLERRRLLSLYYRLEHYETWRRFKH